MSDLHYPDLHIRGFRGFKELDIPELGRVTLVTGKNNTGKSSVLEALRLHAQNAAARTVYSILTYREEHAGWVDQETLDSDPESMFPTSALFYGFPLLSRDIEPIYISTVKETRRTHLKLSVDWLPETNVAPSTRQLGLVQRSLLGDDEVPALVAETEQQAHAIALHRFSKNPVPDLRAVEQPRLPCVFVNSRSGEGTTGLGRLWDRIALTPMEQDVIEALRLIDPRITAVSMVGN